MVQLAKTSNPQNISSSWGKPPLVTSKWFFGHCYVENPILSFVPHQKISEKHFLECPHQTNSRTMTWSRNSFDLTFPNQAKESVTREDSIFGLIIQYLIP